MTQTSLKDLKYLNSNYMIRLKESNPNMHWIKQTSQMHLDKLRDATTEVAALKEELLHATWAKNDQSNIFQRFKDLVDNDLSLQLQREMKCEFDGRGGGKWLLWIIQVICELLVNGTPPSAILSNIGILYKTVYTTALEELPSLSYVRRCWFFVQIIGETVTAMKLAHEVTCKQIPFNATMSMYCDMCHFRWLSLTWFQVVSLIRWLFEAVIDLEDDTTWDQVNIIVVRVRVFFIDTKLIDAVTNNFSIFISAWGLEE